MCALRQFRAGGIGLFILGEAAPTHSWSPVLAASRRLGRRRFYFTSSRSAALAPASMAFGAWPSDVLALWILESGRSRARLKLLQKAGRVNHCHRVSPRARSALASGFDPAAPARSYGVSFATTRSKPLARGGCGVCALRNFGPAGSGSLSLRRRSGADNSWSPVLAASRRLGRRRFYFTSSRSAALAPASMAFGAWPSDVLALWILESGRSRARLNLLQKRAALTIVTAFPARARSAASPAVSIRRRRRGAMGSASPRPDRNRWRGEAASCVRSGISGLAGRGLYSLAERRATIGKQGDR